MLFQSLEYLLLLIASLVLVATVRNVTVKKLGILAASMLFYAYGGQWQTLLFVAVITLAFFLGKWLEKHPSKLLFTVGLVGMFLPLLFYKYVPFVLSGFLGMDSSAFTATFALPIGISFYTFQAAGYVIDVFRKRISATQNYLTFACFVSFFPQLVAGPIERGENLLHQIETFDKPTKEDLSRGFRHVLLGLSLKLLVAETMAAFVNPVYNNLSAQGGLAVLIATVCFGIQIYCDFNGYSQIAIGSAKLMGIDLMQNFNHPYKAHSITTFWKRWHISLSSWFTDYLYIPLGGNRKGAVRTAINTLIVFLVSGLWHGANWTFVLWGLVNGIGLVVERQIYKGKAKGSQSTWWKIGLTYVIVNLFWVFFRANSLSDALLAYKLIFCDTLPQLSTLTSFGAIMKFILRDCGWSSSLLLPAVISMGVYLWYEHGQARQRDLTSCLSSTRVITRWGVYVLLMVLTLCFGATLAQSSFVYFRF